MYKEEDYLLLSGIQHFAFCRRQWALSYIELQWEENIRTVEGKILHEKAHEGGASEKRGDILITRTLPVHSRELGISGECDIVEFHKSNTGAKIHGRDDLYEVIPVEYKRGKPKTDEIDIMQLLAQAMCLEEMLCTKIQYGFLYYGEIKHRQKIEFNEEMRAKLRDMLKEMHSYYLKRYTPKVKISKKCKACSLNEICLPVLCKNKSAIEYIESNILD